MSARIRSPRVIYPYHMCTWTLFWYLSSFLRHAFFAFRRWSSSDADLTPRSSLVLHRTTKRTTSHYTNFVSWVTSAIEKVEAAIESVFTDGEFQKVQCGVGICKLIIVEWRRKLDMCRIKIHVSADGVGRAYRRAVPQNSGEKKDRSQKTSRLFLSDVFWLTSNSFQSQERFI